MRALVFIGAAAAGVRRDLGAKDGDSGSKDALASKLGVFFHQRASARAVGLEYLRRVPAEADPRVLTRLICGRWGESAENLARADMGKLRKLLLRQQQNDFATDRIVCVQGWILSETEARLCALAALV